jgi:hypothetical protein
VVLVVALSLACTSAPEPAKEVAATPTPSEAAPADPPVDPSRLVVAVLDMPRLKRLEAAGFGFGAAMGAPAPPERDDLAALADRSPTWRALAAAWSDEVRAVHADVDRDLVVEHSEAARWPAGNVGRAFDARWLTSSAAAFELVGVVPRFDRTTEHRCGEVRQVYRLYYRIRHQGGPSVGSRLPFTVNVVRAAPTDDCAAWARAWVDDVPAASILAAPVDRVEINAQVVRFPSGVETELGGQAAYLLESWRIGPEGPSLGPLENTPDVRRLRADPSLREALRADLSAHLPEIDDGTYRMPDAFAATRALSWSTAGSVRSANRPFLVALGLDGLPEPPAGARMKTVADVAERLDGLSCTGCHQSRSIAGFHLLGPENPSVDGVTNRVQVAASPHLTDDLVLRRAWAAAMADGRPPDPYRPVPALPAAPGADGDPCRADLPDGCVAPLECRVVVTGGGAPVPYGVCAPPVGVAPSIGAACEAVRIVAGGVADLPLDRPFAARAYSDRASTSSLYGLPEDKRFTSDALNCRPPVLGVPLGRVFRSCTDDERAMVGASPSSPPDALCAVVGGSGFDACAAGDFHACLDTIVGRGMVDACSSTAPCREDYICQRLPEGLRDMPMAMRDYADAGVGFCTPTYFLFQLRVDGHPVPPTRPG